MALPADYQRYAHECLRWAAQAQIEKDREQLLDMAKAWTHVALAQRDVIRQAAFDGNEATRF
jgi:hypothetical protein